jgi:hypothetical protein
MLNFWVQDLKEPWQDNEDFNDWQKQNREMQNLSTGILWLLIARGVIARCFQTRRSQR